MIQEGGKTVHFEKELRFELAKIEDKETAVVRITVWDKDDFNADDEVGSTEIPFKQFTKNKGEHSYKI